jgi:hypothetical protein
MTNVILRDAPITIIFEGKTFNVHVQDANIEAFNGSWVDRGLTNHIAGTITVDGTPIRLTTADGLDPDFMQADFDARYGCTDNLRSTIPPAP